MTRQWSIRERRLARAAAEGLEALRFYHDELNGLLSIEADTVRMLRKALQPYERAKIIKIPFKGRITTRG